MANSNTPSLPNPAATQTLKQDEIPLKDIHLEGSPSFWPPAVGWWILLTLLIVATVALFIAIRSKLRHKAKLRRQREKLLSKLKTYEEKLIKNPTSEAIADINTLLRQLAINYYPRSSTSSLTGLDWLNFLDKSGNTTGFTKGAGRVLIDAPYQSGKPKNLNLDEFNQLVRDWVNHLVDKQKSGKNTSGANNE